MNACSLCGGLHPNTECWLFERLLCEQRGMTTFRGPQPARFHQDTTPFLDVDRWAA